jgi:hypothetical protein
MSVLVRDESHYVAEKPGLEADGQPIARALVLEVVGLLESSCLATDPLPAPISRMSRPSRWARSSRAMVALLERHTAPQQKARSKDDISGMPSSVS